MNKLNVNEDGAILKDNGEILGIPIRTGKIYKKSTRTGRIDLETSIVYSLREEPLGEVDLSTWGDLFKKVLSKSNKNISKDAKISDKITALNEKYRLLKNPKSSNEYLPGKDSHLIVRRWLDHILWSEKYAIDDKNLKKINKEFGWNYSNWEHLCAKEELTEETLSKYEDCVNWYVQIMYHQQRQFSDSFKRKYSEKLACIESL